jgi:hypothetical protein
LSLSLLLFVSKGERKKEKQPETFPKADVPCGHAVRCRQTSQLLGAIKSRFKHILSCRALGRLIQEMMVSAFPGAFCTVVKRL